MRERENKRKRDRKMVRSTLPCNESLFYERETERQKERERQRENKKKEKKR